MCAGHFWGISNACTPPFYHLNINRPLFCDVSNINRPLLRHLKYQQATFATFKISAGHFRDILNISRPLLQHFKYLQATFEAFQMPAGHFSVININRPPFCHKYQQVTFSRRFKYQQATFSRRFKCQRPLSQHLKYQQATFATFKMSAGHFHGILNICQCHLQAIFTKFSISVCHWGRLAIIIIHTVMM